MILKQIIVTGAAKSFEQNDKAFVRINELKQNYKNESTYDYYHHYSEHGI